MGFGNCTISGTALIETALTGESLYYIYVSNDIALLYLKKRGFIFVEQILAITAIVARKAWLKSDLQGFQKKRQSNILKICFNPTKKNLLQIP